MAGIAGEPLPALWPPENWPADFRLEPDETLAGMLGYYAETAQLTEHIVAAAADLGAPSASAERLSVRWVLLHLIKETARHASHADVIRESLDGQQAGALDEAYESGRAR